MNNTYEYLKMNSELNSQLFLSNANLAHSLKGIHYWLFRLGL